MTISKEDNQQVLQSLGAIGRDRRRAEFYESEVIDQQASSGKAKQRATDDAKEMSLKTGNAVDPDFSISNLARLGAKEVMKTVTYVKIQHYGEKDIKSRPVTEEDKIIFAKQWEQFNARSKKVPVQSREIREGWYNLPNDTIRPEFKSTQENWNGGEFSVSFDISPTCT